MISFQTNVNSLIARRNLDINNQSQTRTMQQLSSGYRINSSADDPAGIAIANSYSDSIAEVDQGVANANGAIGQLQILDGGLANISTLLDRMKTLATDSASSTFTGSRNTLNQEYSDLLTELTRQASNIGLNSGGDFNSVLKILVGGGKTASASTVTVDLSGAQNAVDITSLGLSNTNVLKTGIGLMGNSKRLDTPGATFLSGSATASQSFTFNLATSAGTQTITATVNGSVAGITKDEAVAQLAAQLNPYGIDVDVDDKGLLQFTGSTPFNVMDVNSPSGGATASSSLVTTGFYYLDGFFSGFSGPAASDTETLNITCGGNTIPVVLDSTDASSVSAAASTIGPLLSPYGLNVGYNTASGYINISGSIPFSVNSVNSNPAVGFFAPGTTASTPAGLCSAPSNTSNYVVYGAATLPSSPVPENLSIHVDGKSINVPLTAADQASPATAAAAINAQTSKCGVFALTNSAGTGIDLQSASNFSISSDVPGAFAAGSAAADPPQTGNVNNNASTAISAIDNAVRALGGVQADVGAAINTLGYAASLAQSQSTNFSAARSLIKDANMAAAATELSRKQVLMQAAIFAFAQSNQVPDSVLKLLEQS